VTFNKTHARVAKVSCPSGNPHLNMLSFWAVGARTSRGAMILWIFLVNMSLITQHKSVYSSQKRTIIQNSCRLEQAKWASIWYPLPPVLTHTTPSSSTVSIVALIYSVSLLLRFQLRSVANFPPFLKGLQRDSIRWQAQTTVVSFLNRSVKPNYETEVFNIQCQKQTSKATL
jgi:hypothetical protein